MKKVRKIFSGDLSIAFWKEINSINNLSTPDDIRWALYHIGCKCQELEAKYDEVCSTQKPRRGKK